MQFRVFVLERGGVPVESKAQDKALHSPRKLLLANQLHSARDSLSKPKEIKEILLRKPFKFILWL